MCIELRGTGKYAYLSVRRGSRVTRVYLGSGPLADMAERLLELEREKRREAREAERRAVRRMIDRLEAPRRWVAELSARVDQLFKQAMKARGYYQHKRQWRRRGKAMGVPDLQGLGGAIEAERARRLFEEADDVPALIRRLGGRLADRVREQLIARIAGDAVSREAVRREADMMRRELEGERPTVIERLVAEQVVIAWLDLRRCDLLYESFADELERREVASHVVRMRNAAGRNYLATLRALALIRRAAPAVTVNVTKTVNMSRRGRVARAVMHGEVEPCEN